MQSHLPTMRNAVTQGPESRIIDPLPTAELERRWQAVSIAMETANLDVLLIRATNDFLGGYIKWFTDLPASTGYPVTLVFPRGGGISWISQGHFGLDRVLENDPIYRGVVRMLGAPGYASVAYSTEYEIAAVAKALEPYRHARIGIVGSSNIPYRMADSLRSAAGSALIDASTLVDSLAMVKSPEEIACIRRTAEIQDACMEAVAKQARAGMRDIEISAIAQSVALQHGSEQGVYLVASAPIGTPAAYNIRHFQGRTLQPGDHFNLLVEVNGPSGYYTELGRMFVLGEATAEMHREMDFVLEAQDYVATLLRPGMPAAQVWTEFNHFMVKHGRPEEKRLFCHGQGYDLVERPLVRHDEAAVISAGMNFACHPTFITPSLFCTSCDNYLVSEQDTTRIHQFRRGIIEIN